LVYDYESGQLVLLYFASMNKNYHEEAAIAAQFIMENKIILYPTDTIWGLGANINDQNSVARVASIKGRPIKKSFIVLVDSLSMLKRYVINLHPRIETLLHYHKKPLTIVYPNIRDIPEYLLSEDKSLAIRVCEEVFCKELIKIIDRPLISTSANLSGSSPPGNFSEISLELVKKVDYVVRYRQNEKSLNQASVIARYDDDGELEFLR